MGTKVGLVIVAAAVVLAVGAYAFRRPPAPARGGEAPRTVVDEVADARAVVARINARSELTASATPFLRQVPHGPIAEPMAEPVPAALPRGPEGQGQVDERQAAAALQKLRAQMEFERQMAQESIPKVGAIMGGAGGRFQALIGEAFVSEGDVVQGYRVKKCQADSVEFERDGKTWVQKVD
jgi:hypothetical protein